MKKERVAGIVLAAVNALLLLAGFIPYCGLDRVEPYFEFQAMEFVYEENMDVSRLLDGITAFDNRDGDITDKIVVEKLIENREQNSVVIIYAVSDKAGNVAKCSREFPAVFRQPGEGEEGAQVQEEWLMQSGFWTELEGKGIGKNGGEPESRAEENKERKNGEYVIDEGETAENTPEGNETKEEAALEATEDENHIQDRLAEEGMAENGEEDGNDRTTEDGERENSQEAEGTEQRQKETTMPDSNIADFEIPVLTLKTTEVKTSVGMGPAWVEIIDTLSDDKDGYETLFRNMEVSKYDKNTAGTYTVTVSTKDSEGHRSQTVPLTIIVK